MAKDRTPLDIEEALKPEPTVPTGADANGRAPLDLSGLEEEAPASGSTDTSALAAERQAAQMANAQAFQKEVADAGGMAAYMAKQNAASAAAPTPQSIPDAITENILAIPGAAISGAGKAVKSTFNAVVDAKEFVQNHLTDVMFGGKIDSRSFTEQEARDLKAGSDKVFAPIITEQNTIAGKATQSVSQFVVGMLGAGKFLKAANILQGAGPLLGFARTSLQGALTDATVFDPTEERLSNLLEEHPSLSNPVSAYLAAKPEDSAAEGRLKNAVEGLILGTAVEGFLRSVRGIRSIRAAKAAGDPKAAAEELAKMSEDLEAMHAKGEAPAGTEAAKSQPIPGKTLTTEEMVAKTLEETKGKSVDELQAMLKGEAPKPVAPIDSTTKEVDDIVQAARDKTEPTVNPGDHWNFDKIQASGGIKKVLEETAAQVAPKIKGLEVQTWEETTKLADSMGLDKRDLVSRLGEMGKSFDEQSAVVLTARKAQNSIAKQIEEEARKIDSGITPDRSKINALVGELKEMESALLPVRLAQARGTRSWGIIADDVSSLQTIKAIIASGGDATAITKLVRGPSVATRAINAHNEYWINSLLSGPKTHLVNMTSNTLNTFARPTEKILGGQVREGLSEFMGMAKSIKDSVSMAAKSFSLEESILDPHNLKNDAPRFGISAGNAGLKSNTFMGAMTDWLGKAVRLPTRFLMAEDEFFKQLNYRSNVYARATREGVEKNLDGKALADYIETRFESAFDGTGKGLDDAALQESRIATFTEDLDPNGVIGKLNKVANEHPGVRLIVPFIRTPTNIVKQLGHRTPGINLLMKSYREELAAGGTRAAAARGKFVTGGALWGAGALLAADGKLTGRGPENADERAALLATGWRPYSYKTDDGRYLDYSRLDPYGMAIGLVADYTEAKGHMADADAEDLALAMTAALARNLTSKTYLRGITETLDALSQPDHKAEFFLQNRAGSYVPSGLKQIADLVPETQDDTMREVRSMMDAIKARTPGLSKTLPPKRNLLGEPIHYPPGLGPDSISPFAMSKDLGDPVKAELARLSYGFKMPSEKQGNVDLTKFKNEKGQDAYDRLLELRSIERKGRYTLAERLNAEISSDHYQKLPDGNDEYSSRKLERVREILGEYHIVTLKRLRKEFPEVDAAIKTDQKNAKVVPRKGVGALAPLLGQ